MTCAAVDGFAFLSGSGAPLRLVGTATPGKAFDGSVRIGECVAIRAGTRLPDGCDTVAKSGQCSREGDRIWLGALLRRGAHVSAAPAFSPAGDRNRDLPAKKFAERR
jgi:molybdopterin molybdotransferase